MFTQNTKFDLFVELSAEEQQLLSGGGGCYQSPPPCCKPKKQCGCGDYQKNDQYMPSNKYGRYPGNDDYRD
jgi:predicted metal-binding transcription factor (methanogenesis marker protein 9)